MKPYIAQRRNVHEQTMVFRTNPDFIVLLDETGLFVPVRQRETSAECADVLAIPGDALERNRAWHIYLAIVIDTPQKYFEIIISIWDSPMSSSSWISASVEDGPAAPLV